MNTHTRNRDQRWRWYHGVLFYVGVQALSFGLGKLVQRTQQQSSPRIGESLVGNADNNAFYNKLVQPVFAPPDWSFAPVWTINNALCIWGALRVLNMPKTTPGRTAFLALQSVVWLSFSGFNALYFGLRSPINGAIDTVIGFIGTIATMYVAIAQLKDWRTVASQSTILPWLVIASATATTVAAWNRDDFYNTTARTQPVAGWAKALND